MSKSLQPDYQKSLTDFSNPYYTWVPAIPIFPIIYYIFVQIPIS